MIEVEYLDHMGDDLATVDAARVSYNKTSRWEYTDWRDSDDKLRKKVLSKSDTSLINYLADHQHSSPFGHSYAKFRVKAPVFVARQLVKHKFLRWNEVSRRYVDDDPEFYKPVLREAVSNKKQGSGCPINNHLLDAVIEQAGIEAAKQYRYLLKVGVCEEQARSVLTLNHMTTWIWSGSLDALANMCRLRCATDTQAETRMVANKISEKMYELFPVSWRALLDG